MLDNYTLAILFIMISTLLIIALIFNIWSRVRYPGIIIWTVGVIIITFSFFGLAYQRYLPKILGIVITNNAVIGGFICFLIGVDRFYGKKSKGLWYAAPLVISIAVFIFFTYVTDNTKFRITYISVIFVIILSMTIYSIITGLPKVNRRPFVLPVLGFGVYLIFSLVRIVSSILMPPVQSIQDTGFMLSMTFFLAIFSITTTSLSLLVITKARFENELLEKNSELNKINETKDKLFSIISHDLRGPIGGTAHLLNILISKFNQVSNEQLSKWLITIKDSTDNTYSLLNNLLSWAESQRGSISYNPETISLSVIITDTISTLNHLFENKNITVKNLITDNLYVFADSIMVNTIIRNLLSNAVKYSYNNGIIEIGETRDNVLLGIYIKDNGCGMDDSTTNNLFNFSYTRSTPGTSGESGSGFGLILTKEFVDVCGGKILVESIVDSGSVFKIFFPVA